MAAAEDGDDNCPSDRIEPAAQDSDGLIAPVDMVPPRGRRLLGAASTSPRTVLGGWGLPSKRQIFTSYHHALDSGYYRALAAMCDDCTFLQDNSPDRRIDSDDADYQERRLREGFINGTSVTVVLCG